MQPGWKKQLINFAEFVYRKPGDVQRLEHGADFAVKILATVFVFGVLAALTGPMVLRDTMGWSDARPSVPVSRSDWRVLYSAEACKTDETAAPECPASLQASSLWNSSHRLTDPVHYARVRDLRNSAFWIGLVVSETQLTEARRNGANRLLLGHLVSSYEVWLDGRLSVSARYRHVRSPVVLTLPLERLSRTEPLRVAIRVIHDQGSIFPDQLALTVPEGLATPEQAEIYRRRNTFEHNSRPAFFAGIYLVLSGMFLVMWFVNRKKQEYWYMGFYALVQAIMQVLSIDTNVVENVSTTLLYRIQLEMLFLEAGAALALGMAFARVRPGLVKLTLPLFLGAPFVLQLVSRDPQFFFNAAHITQTWLVPACYGAGSLVCASQLWLLRFDKGRGERNSSRAFRLLVFSVALVLIGEAYWLESDSGFSLASFSYWFRFMNLGVVIFISTLVLLEYREQERIIEKTPISPYHRRPVLPDQLSGVVLAIDIKDSEALFRLGARKGRAGSLVHSCLSKIWGAVTTNGGIVLFTEGDMILAFFEREADEKALATAIKTIEAGNSALQRFHEELILKKIVPVDHPGIFFRGSIAAGSIKPVWQEMGANRYASWIETGNTNVLVECARLLEFERQVPSQGSTSVIVLKQDLANHILSGEAGNNRQWIVRDHTMTGKHEHTYTISAFSVHATLNADPANSL